MKRLKVNKQKKPICILLYQSEERCLRYVDDHLHAFADGGIKAILCNPEKVRICKINFDHCIDIEGPRADFVFHFGRDVQIVELKASDVEKGLEQIIATAEFFRGRRHRHLRYSGTIVGRKCPKFDGVIRRQIDIATTKHCIRLRVLTSGNRVSITNY